MAIMNKDRQPHGFTVGQIVYMYNPSGCKLQTGSRKIQYHFVGPLAIYKCIIPNQFLLMSLDGVLYPMVVEEARLKLGLISTHKGVLYTNKEYSCWLLLVCGKAFYCCACAVHECV